MSLPWAELRKHMTQLIIFFVFPPDFQCVQHPRVESNNYIRKNHFGGVISYSMVSMWTECAHHVSRARVRVAVRSRAIAAVISTDNRQLRTKQDSSLSSGGPCQFQANQSPETKRTL